MKKILLITTLIMLFSCSDNRMSDYEKIINQVDSIKIDFKSMDKTVELHNEAVPKFKEILIRNIEPTDQHKIDSDIKVDFYSGGQKVGSLIINNNPEKPFANFDSDKLNFGFRLTYGIGIYLDEIKHSNQL